MLQLVHRTVQRLSRRGSAAQRAAVTALATGTGVAVGSGTGNVVIGLLGLACAVALGGAVALDRLRQRHRAGTEPRER